MQKLTITRRTFLKAAAVTGIAAAVVPHGKGPLKGLVEAKEPTANEGEVKVYKSACRSCRGGCWNQVHVRDGRVVKIEGDPACHMTRTALNTP
jgi:anaerobic selenocysteine-containing dehydrogenase